MGTITSECDWRIGSFTQILLAVVSGSTTAIQIFEAVRLKRVGITCLPSSDTNSGTFGFQWIGDREPHTTHTMIYSQGVPAKWNFYPPEGSFASFWITQDTAGIDTISVFTLDPDNSTVKVVLDLEFEYVIADGGCQTVTISSAATFSGIAALTQPLNTDEFVPVDLQTVTI
jgi:hypothetical protein